MMNETITNDGTIAQVGANSNMALGVIGSLVGALIGAAVWVGFYQIGFIAYLGGLAIIFCACMGFQILGKSKSMSGVIISIITSVVMLFIAIYLCWAIDIYFDNEFAKNGLSFIDALLFVPDFFMDPEFIGEFIKELAIGLILIGVGCTKFVREAIHLKKVEQEITTPA